MASCIAFFKIGFKNSFAYKSNVIMGIFGSVFSVIAQIALWKFVFIENSEMTDYMMIYVVISQLVRILYENHISYMIEEKVYTGDVVIDLIKPINPILNFWSTSFGMIAARIINRGILLVAVFSPLLMNIKADFKTWILFIVACGMGYIIISIIYMLVGYLSFVLIDIHPYVRLVEDTIRLFSGAVIPLAFFPSWLAVVAKAMPFHFMYSFPIRLLLEKLPSNEIFNCFFIMMIWIMALSAALRFSYAAAVKKCILQGG